MMSANKNSLSLSRLYGFGLLSQVSYLGIVGGKSEKDTIEQVLSAMDLLDSLTGMV